MSDVNTLGDISKVVLNGSPASERVGIKRASSGTSILRAVATGKKFIVTGFTLASDDAFAFTSLILQFAGGAKIFDAEGIFKPDQIIVVGNTGAAILVGGNGEDVNFLTAQSAGSIAVNLWDFEAPSGM